MSRPRKQRDQASTHMTSPTRIGSPNSAKKCYEFGHINNRGLPCGANAIKDMPGCARHLGIKKDLAKAKGAVVTELRNWGLTSQQDLVDPGETLLKLVTQSATRVDLLSRLLAEAYEAAGRLKKAFEADQLVLAEEEDRPALDDHSGPRPEHAAMQTARQDLERIFNQGGVAALVGLTYSATKDGDIYATGEKLRGLAEAEAAERDRCASFAAKAVAAKLGERRVKLAEEMGTQALAVVIGTLAALGVSTDETTVRLHVARQIATLTGTGPLTIEGVAA